MGLDQYAYVAARAGQRDEFYEGADWVDGDLVNLKMSKPVEIAYWRKHPNLHGWMKALYSAKGGKGEFNGDELELTWEDIDALEHDINNNFVSKMNTTGFFFGNPSDNFYRKQDLEFIKRARAELFSGLKVFYNSSW